MSLKDVSRRSLLKGGGAALAGFTVLRVAGPAHAFPGHPGQQEKVPWDDDPPDSAQAFVQPGGQVIPWLDQPPANPVPEITGNLLQWESLDSFLTPANDFFYVQHYGEPDGLDEASWRVGIGGLVRHPQSLALADLKARPVHEVNFTLECSGNADTSSDFFFGGIGTARWGGARLAPLLEKAGILKGATEVVFWGIDRGTVTIRDNAGIVSGGNTGTLEPGTTNLTITEQFARSMSLDEALHRDNLLCYEMNGEPLPPKNGFPVRLIAPGWYGVANVKWLTRIEVTDHRYAGRFMAREYVQVREEERDGQPVWTFATVSHERLKSAPARVTRLGSQVLRRGRRLGRSDRQSAGENRQRPVDRREAHWPPYGRKTITWLRVEVLDVRLGNAHGGRARGHVAGLRRRRQHAASTGRSLPRQQENILGEERAHQPSNPDSLTLRGVDQACRRRPRSAACCADPTV